MNLGPLILIFSILMVVMIHEAGHFLVAKAFNFKATKFFLGFGPTLFSRQRGETEYGVKAFPLGGFVKIVGMSPYEEVPPEDQPRSYPNKPRWQRALVLVAGSATHFLVAFAIITATVMAIGIPTDEPTTTLGVVQERVDGSEAPSAAAGLRPGDKVVEVDGRQIESWDEISNYIKEHPGESVTFVVLRDDERVTLTADIGQATFDADGLLSEFAPAGTSPPPAETGETTGGFLGVSPEPEYETEGPIGAMGTAATMTWDITWASIEGIPTVFAPVFNGDLFEALSGEGEREADEGPVGLVGVGRLASQSVEKGQYLDLIELIVFFTIFVGIMNLLPLPPLDGGHLAVLAYEGATGRTVDVRKLIPVAAAVISFFVLLFIAVLYLDLARPIANPF